MTALTAEFAPLHTAGAGTAYVYFILSADREVIYIGSTRNLKSRVAQHARGRAWWDEAAYLRAFPFDSLDEALAAEARYIAVSNPRHNKHLRGPGQFGMVLGLLVGAVPTDQQMQDSVFVADVARSVSA